MSKRTFILPQHTLNVEKVKDHHKDQYDWTLKKDGFYIQVVNGEAFSKTGRLMPGLPPLGFHPDLVYEMEAYAETLGATKSALGRKVLEWDKVDFSVHNFIEEGLTYHERNQQLQAAKQLSIIVPPIALTGTIAEAITYAETLVYPSGGEGLVGRLRSNLKYFPGSRNKTQVKVKANCFIDAIYLRTETGTARAFLTNLATGAEFCAKVQTEKMAAALKPGKQVKIRCMLVNTNGVPRDPVIWDY